MQKDALKINFLHGNAEQKARRTTMMAAGLFTLFVGLLAAVGAGASFRAASHGTTVFIEVGNLLRLSEITHFDWNANASTEDPFATPDNRINILLLGIGGEGHEGSQLTDTIILASLDRAQKRIGLVSIPRDLAFPLGGGRFEKINAVNAYAEQSAPGEGARQTADAFEKLFNIRLDRVVKIDFKGFTQFIDALGGLDIAIERTFTDPQYPTTNSSASSTPWRTVTFTKGTEHMDGAHVLTYVRSRHGSNGEGSDFARSRRQQIVMESVRTKILSLNTLANPKKLTDIWTTASAHIQSDVSAWDLLKLAPLALNFAETAITNTVLTDGPNGELVPTSVENAYMLFPRKPDWSEIRQIVANPFQTKAEREAQNKPKQRIVVTIKNGTTRIGFASQVSEKLTGMGYTIAETGNATQRGYERTVIYDLTDGKKTEELANLRSLLSANVSTSPPHDGSVLTDLGTRETANTTSTDFLIILGDSSFGLVNPYHANPQSP